MRRFFTILLVILIGLLAALILFCEAEFNYSVARYIQSKTALTSLKEQLVEADERGPLADNEGRIVRVSGTARRVSELPVLKDELLGISVAASSLSRDLTAEERTKRGESTLCIMTHPSSAELPSGMRLSAQTTEQATEWELGGFRFCISSRRLDEKDRHIVPKEEMSPVPEVLQGAEWNEYGEAWSYNDGTLTVRAEYCAPPPEEEMTICGRQVGNRLEPFSYPMPRSLALSAFVMSFTDHALPQEKEFPLGADIPEEELQGGFDEYVAANCMGLCVLLLPVLLLLVVLLRVCQRRRVWPALLYTLGGVVLLTLLNTWNARWLCW